MRQIHGAGVLVVTGTGSTSDGLTDGRGAPDADALVSMSPTACLAVLTADCASIALASTEGVFGAVHAGWRGLVGGVVEAVTAAMRSLGATDITGALGPCIHRECYEFSEPDLATVAHRYGPSVRASTASGMPALDLPAAVAAALSQSAVRQVDGIDRCTACAAGSFSHRKHLDVGRQALLVWSAVSGE